MHSASDEMAGMEDCCPTAPCPLQADQCQSMAACGQLSPSVVVPMSSPVAYTAIAKVTFVALFDRGAPPRAASPPFRPPRV